MLVIFLGSAQTTLLMVSPLLRNGFLDCGRVMTLAGFFDSMAGHAGHAPEAAALRRISVTRKNTCR